MWYSLASIHRIMWVWSSSNVGTSDDPLNVSDQQDVTGFAQHSFGRQTLQTFQITLSQTSLAHFPSNNRLLKTNQHKLTWLLLLQYRPDSSLHSNGVEHSQNQHWKRRLNWSWYALVQESERAGRLPYLAFISDLSKLLQSRGKWSFN